MTIEPVTFHGYQRHPRHPDGPGPLEQGSCPNCNARAVVFAEVGPVEHIDGDRRRRGTTYCEECDHLHTHKYLASDVRTRFIIHK